MPETTFQIYVPDTKAIAHFAPQGPGQRVLTDTPKLKSIVVGLEPGGRIPIHPEAVSVYHFREGEGVMTVGEETFAVKPGVTVMVPDGEKRGLNARTRMIFLAARGGS